MSVNTQTQSISGPVNFNLPDGTTLDNCVIGGTTPAAGTFTTLKTTSPITEGLTAVIVAKTGGGQSLATALTEVYNNVTTVASNFDSVKLLAATAATVGIRQTIKNNGASILSIFPTTGQTINGMAANLSVDLAVTGEATFRATTATNWETNEAINLNAPTTQSGSLAIVAANNASNVQVKIVNASFGQASTLTIPDPGNATASFVMTKGTQTISGNITMSGTNTISGATTFTTQGITITPTTNQIVLGTTNTVTITSTAPASSRTHTIADPLTNSNFTLQDGVGGTLCSRTTTTTTVTSSTALVNITGLTVNVQAAGVYAVTAYVPLTSGASGGSQIALGGTATWTSINTTAENLTASATAVTTGTTATPATSIGGSTALNILALLNATVVINAAGTLTVMIAQNASNGTSTVALANGYMTATRIA